MDAELAGVALADGVGSWLSGTADADAVGTDADAAGIEADGDGCVPVHAARTTVITARVARVDRRFMAAP